MTNGNATTTSFSSREYSGWPGCKRDEGGALNGVLTSLTSLVLIVQVIVVVVNKVIYLFTTTVLLHDSNDFWFSSTYNVYFARFAFINRENYFI